MECHYFYFSFDQAVPFHGTLSVSLIFKGLFSYSNIILKTFKIQSQYSNIIGTVSFFLNKDTD